MVIKKHRVFFNAAAEEKWLDSLGEKGLLLVGLAPFTYRFEARGGKWTYSVEWLDSSPLTPENAAYIKEREGRDVYCGSKNCYAYFASGKECVHNERHVSLAKKRYFTIAVFWFVIASLMAGLLIYNVIWAGNFRSMGITVNTKTMPAFINGSNPASAFLWLVIPLTAAAAFAAVYCVYTAFAYKKYALALFPKVDPKSEEDTCN